MSDTVSTIKSLRPASIAGLSDKELDDLLRRGTRVVNQRIKRFNEAGIAPTTASPNISSKISKGIDITGKTRQQKIKILQTEQRILRDPNATVRGYRKAITSAAREYEKTHPTATKVPARGITPDKIRKAHGRTKIVYDKHGKPIEVRYGTKGLKKKELGDYWDAFHRARDAAGIAPGSDGSQDLLDEFHGMYIEEDNHVDIVDKVSERYKELYEEQEERSIKEREFTDEKEPSKIF